MKESRGKEPQLQAAKKGNLVLKLQETEPANYTNGEETDYLLESAQINFSLGRPIQDLGPTKL